MNITNCPSCGALFVRGPRAVCAKCIAAEDEQFETVKEYLTGNPEAKLEEVAEATEVDGQMILKFIRTGRLVVGRPGSFGLCCERCGQPVNTGLVCPECAQSMTREIRESTGVQKTGTRMHVYRDGRR